MRPQDKHNSITPAKPLTPSMSTTALRASKSPLTPKLAGCYPSQPQRRNVRPDTLTPQLSSQPDISTSSPSHLNANITPRSAPRSTRRDGASSPSDTPTSTQHGSRNPPNSTGSSSQPEVNRREGSKSLREKSTHNEALPYTSTSRPVSSCDRPSDSPMFFHASDAKSPGSPFDTSLKPTSSAKSPTSRLISNANSRSEGFDGPEINSQQSRVLNKRQGRGYGAALAKAPDLPTPYQDAQLSNSVSREPKVSEREHRRSSSQSARVNDANAPQLTSPSLHGPSPLSPQSSPQSLHTRSISTGTSNTARQIHPLLISPPSNPASLASDHNSQGNTSSPRLSPRIESPRSPPAAETAHPFPRAPSPSKSTSSPTKEDQPPNNALYRMSETSASARNERKVLDLEISNSSLLAINRTLEREMRKQNAELRRFRRLSRSGRISMTTSHRSASGGLSVVSETDDAESNRSLCETPADLSDSDDNLSSLSDEESMSSGSVAEHDTRHRTRDEKRFLHDLSKHQQLLVDSQNMNQSIKRCVGWTENLIVEAKKALEFKVQVNDIEIGGRVLNSDEVDSEWESGRGLLSPPAELPPLPDTDDVFELTFADDENDARVTGESLAG